jgi:ribosomal protein RSM22 (predicted rRNA methylase)
MDLPHLLRLALEREVRGHAGPALARASAELSASYRRAGGGPVDAAAYAVARMPATFAATAAAMGALAAGLPAFAPATLLDAGAGTGAALWAADATWVSLSNATLLEGAPQMADLGRRLATRGGPTIAGAHWVRADLTAAWDTPLHDLVSAAYVLGELPEPARATLVARLWEHAAGALLLVEPGTPRGWTTIRAAREQLRAAGAHLVAPCPHSEACPMPADPAVDWCHFAQRLARSQAHRAAKGGALGYEDEKYAYIAAARAPGDPVAARVLRHPLVRPGRAELQLCTRDGLRRLEVTRGDRAAWGIARDLRWGDAAPPELSGPDQ